MLNRVYRLSGPFYTDTASATPGFLATLIATVIACVRERVRTYRYLLTNAEFRPLISHDRGYEPQTSQHKQSSVTATLPKVSSQNLQYICSERNGKEFNSCGTAKDNIWNARCLALMVQYIFEEFKTESVCV